MSMRWMKLEAQPFVPSLYFLLISRNKVKIVFFYLFPDLSVQYKNIPKIKVLRMTCLFNMIFSGIFEDLLCKNYRGRSCHLVTRVVGPLIGRALLPCGPMVALLHLSQHPSSSSVSHKPENPTQPRVPATFAVIFDLLAQSTSRKTAWGDCSLVCDSSIGPISFCSSSLFIANLCCIGDHVLELACQIHMVLSSSNA